MGKNIEYAILKEIINLIKPEEKLIMEAIPTNKNSPIREFANEVTKEKYVIKDIKNTSYISIDR